MCQKPSFIPSWTGTWNSHGIAMGGTRLDYMRSKAEPRKLWQDFVWRMYYDLLAAVLSQMSYIVVFVCTYFSCLQKALFCFLFRGRNLARLFGLPLSGGKTCWNEMLFQRSFFFRLVFSNFFQAEQQLMWEKLDAATTRRGSRIEHFVTIP